MEFTIPIPAAAAVPVKKADGMGQKMGIEPRIPSVPMDRKITDRMGFEAKTPLRIKPNNTHYTYRT